MKEPWGKCIIQYWLLKSTHKCKQSKHYYIFLFYEKRMTCVLVCYLDFIPGLTSTTLSDTCTTRMVTSPDSGWLWRFRKSLTLVSRKLPNFVWGNPVWRQAGHHIFYFRLRVFNNYQKSRKKNIYQTTERKALTASKGAPSGGCWRFKDSIQYLQIEYKQVIDETDHIIYYILYT